jgi:Kef-type K+ transport system membrane component KefB/mannitol/fructose-specific phosphotransferase system IIA component (Ntr-type)
VSEQDALVFLLSLAVLLGVARLLGEGARAIGLPLVVGEIAAGILLGQTGLGRVLPEAHAFLFPAGAPAAMLAGYTTLGVVLLLVVAGLEIDLGIVKRRGKSALLIALLGMVVPMIGGVALGLLVPDWVLGPRADRPLFALFLGVALSISALPLIARTLIDLGVYKTDIGLLIMTAAMLNDLVGWLAFSVLLGPVHGGRVDLVGISTTVALALAFAAACLVLGRRLVDFALSRLERHADVAPGRILAIVTVLGLLGAAATQAIGLHAMLGGLVVGAMIGGCRHLRERTRQTIQQFVTSAFAPVFFASVALRVDFLSSFDLPLSIAVFAVASVAKVVGGGVGARLSGMAWREALAVGWGLNARGAMEIILALFARSAGLISDRLFVALVIMALGTSLLAGPMMKLLLHAPARGRRNVEDAAALVQAGAFVPALSAVTSARAIEELGHALRSVLGDLVEPALIAVLERELVAPTGLGDDVAIPHAAVEGLSRPVVALGLSPEGVDFDAPDGRPARIVFLLLLPPRAYEREVRVLSALARSVFDEPARAALLEARSIEDAVRCLDAHGGRHRPPGDRRDARGETG